MASALEQQVEWQAMLHDAAVEALIRALGLALYPRRSYPTRARVLGPASHRTSHYRA